MANRTLRRTPSRTRSFASGVVSGTGDIPVTIGGARNIAPRVDAESGDNGSELDGAELDSAVEPDESDGVRTVEVDPSDIGEYIAASDRERESDSEPRRRRKRGPNRKVAARNAASITGLLNLAHTWGAVVLKMPDLNLEPAEVKQLDEAYAEFCKYHSMPGLSDKTMSEINMGAALVMIYGTRLWAMFNKPKKPVLIMNKLAETQHQNVN